MFVGHALLAFALAALIADWRGWSRRRALSLGVVTGAFAAIPDVDVVYALFAMDPGQFLAGSGVRPGAFWEPANDVHRSTTHSLIVAAIAGPAFGLWTAARDRDASPGRRRRTTASRALALGLLAALVAAAAAAGGAVDALVMSAFAAAGLGVATIARRSVDLPPRIVAPAAAAGLASHPWGDLLTGQPPRLLYPVDGVLVPDRVVLAADPTLHLLVAFALELAVVALAAAVLARLVGHSPRRLVDRRAALGAGYGVAALVLVPPTIHVSYRFVFSILTVGVVCGALSGAPATVFGPFGSWSRPRATSTGLLAAAFTGLAAIAIALASYAVVYLIAG